MIRKALHVGMQMNFAEAFGEADLFRRCQLLIAEKNHLVREKRVMHVGEVVVAHVAEVDAMKSAPSAPAMGLTSIVLLRMGLPPLARFLLFYLSQRRAAKRTPDEAKFKPVCRKIQVTKAVRRRASAFYMPEPAGVAAARPLLRGIGRAHLHGPAAGEPRHDPQRAVLDRAPSCRRDSG